jgi:hypothetical protein
MNFILVNGRTPIKKCSCALCGQQIRNDYLRETETHLYYCDRTCYSDHCKRVMSLASLKRAAKAALVPGRAKRSCEAGLLLTTD